MFENTYGLPILSKRFEVLMRDDPVAEYLRWEYPEADRASLLIAWSRAARRKAMLRPTDAIRPGHGVRRPLRAIGTVGESSRAVL